MGRARNASLQVVCEEVTSQSSSLVKLTPTLYSRTGTGQELGSGATEPGGAQGVAKNCTAASQSLTENHLCR